MIKSRPVIKIGDKYYIRKIKWVELKKSKHG